MERQDVGLFMDEEDWRDFRRRRRKDGRGFVVEEIVGKMGWGDLGMGWEILRRCGGGKGFVDIEDVGSGEGSGFWGTGKVRVGGLGFEEVGVEVDGRRRGIGKGLRTEEEDVYEERPLLTVLGRRGRRGIGGGWRDGESDEDDVDVAKVLQKRLVKQRKQAEKRLKVLETKQEKKELFADFELVREDMDFKESSTVDSDNDDLKVPKEFAENPVHDFENDRFPSKLSALSAVLQKDLARVTGAERRRLLLGERLLAPRKLERTQEEKEKTIAALKAQMSNAFVSEGTLIPSQNDKNKMYSKPRVVGDIVRETSPWQPASIICKRLGIPRPEVEMPVIIDVGPSVLGESQTFIDATISKESRTAGLDDGNMDEAIVEALPGPLKEDNRPSDELYAAVFGNVDETKGSDGEMPVMKSIKPELSMNNSVAVLQGDDTRKRTNEDTPAVENPRKFDIAKKRRRRPKPLASDFF